MCEKNADREGVGSRCTFQHGDANRLDFPDESFDAVVSNYVYHNIIGADKQKLLLETLRVLKKGSADDAGGFQAAGGKEVMQGCFRAPPT